MLFFSYTKYKKQCISIMPFCRRVYLKFYGRFLGKELDFKNFFYFFYLRKIKLLVSNIFINNFFMLLFKNENKSLTNLVLTMRSQVCFYISFFFNKFFYTLNFKLFKSSIFLCFLFKIFFKKKILMLVKLRFAVPRKVSGPKNWLKFFASIFGE